MNKIIFHKSNLSPYLIIAVVVLILSAPFVSGQVPVKGNTVERPNIKTVQFFKEGFEMGTPVMKLNSTDKLKLVFDDLDADLKPYKFTIVHCEADWTVSSDLFPRDYIEGFDEDNIDGFSYSFNTAVRYTHYSLVFPTQNLKPKLSGNYFIIVYTDDSGDPVFTWRFMVCENSPLAVEGQVHQANSISDRNSKQQIDFTIHYNGAQIDNPARSLKIVVTQNDRQDNVLSNIQPSFSRSETLDYTNNDAISFDGGNEFRAFDIKSLVYQTERIKKIEHTAEGYDVTLLDDAKRTLKNYASDKDINGRKLIKSDDNVRNSEIEADYAWVSFTLPFTPELANGQLYLLGALTDWQLDENSKMTYDYEKKSYVKKLLLKQGYYNYLYLFRNRSTNKSEIFWVEGNHWETENEYTIWVYYRGGADLYDRLLAIQNLNSIH
jgi:hypothetical protein